MLYPAPVGPRILYTTGTSVGNGADTTEDTLQTYTLPAGVLVNIGDTLHIVAGGVYISSTDTKTARIRWGSTVILANPIGLAAGVTTWFADMWVVKTGVNAQSYISSAVELNAAVNGVRNGVATETDTAGIIIKVSGQNGTNSVLNSITCQMYTVLFIPAP